MRVVSLVPSLTEAVAVSLPGVLAGATDWCSHPAGLDVPRVGGTKNPKLDRILALAPDLVVANEEENREPDLTALREAGVEVLVTEVRNVPQAFRELARVLEACGAVSRPRWLDEAEAAWSRRRRPGPAGRRWCRSGAGPGWCSAATRSLVTSSPGWASTTSGRITPSAIPASPSRSCGRPPRMSSCCRTSRTASRPTTGPRPFRGCAALSSAGAI